MMRGPAQPRPGRSSLSGRPGAASSLPAGPRTREELEDEEDPDHVGEHLRARSRLDTGFDTAQGLHKAHGLHTVYRRIKAQGLRRACRPPPRPAEALQGGYLALFPALCTPEVQGQPGLPSKAFRGVMLMY